MNEHSERQHRWDLMREKIIGLGEESTRKSYYPELQQRVRELHESEIRFQEIFDSINDAILVHDIETGEILDINSRTRELFGYTREEALGSTVDIISSGEPPYTADNALELMKQAAAGEPRLTKWHVRNKAGVLFWIEVSLRRANIGGSDRIIAVARDITDRLRAEEALRASEEKYRELVQNANSLIIRWTCDGMITFFNEFAQTFFGYTESEVIGRSVIGTIVPETDSSGRDLASLMMDICNNPEHYETNVNENMLKDGQRVWIAWNNKPVFDENHRLTEVLSVGVDVTQLRRTTEALRESTQMMQLVLDTVPARVFWKSKDLVYIGCSRLFAADAGLVSPSEIAGKTDFDLPWKSTQAEAYRADDREVIESGMPKLGYEESQTTAEGRTTWIVTSKVPLRNAAGEIIGVLGTYEDVTEQKLAIERLRRSEERFRNLFERAADALFLGTRSGRFVEVNQRACDYLGYSRDELLRITAFDVVVDYSQEEMTQHWQTLSKEGALTIEGYQRRKDGTIFPVESRLSLFDYGDQTLVLAVVRDITDRRRSEEAVQRRSRQLEVLSKTSRRLNSVLEIPVVLRELVKSALDVCGAQCGASGLLVDGKMVFREYNNAGKLVPIDYQFEPGYGVPGWVMQTRAPYVSNDVENDPHVVPAIQQEMGFYNLADIPIISRSGDLLGCIEIHNSRDHRPFDEIDVTMLEGLAASAAVALENAQMIAERQRAEEDRRALEQQVEEQKRQFYRETIFSVTGGRLDICEEHDLIPYLNTAQTTKQVRMPSEVSDARREVEEFLRRHDLEASRLDTFMIGVGEAITNAIKHGHEGIVYAGELNGSVWVGIEDHGTGMDSLILPRAILLRGYSTKPSLGLGYSIMLEVADQIHLKTDKQGTTVILRKCVQEQSVELSLQDLPDTWDSTT